MHENIKAIAFDIDDTLAPGISWLDLTHELGASVEQHKEIFRAFIANEIDYPTSKTQLLSLWQTTGKANYNDMQRIFSSWPLATDAREVIDALRQKYQICLITGSMSLYAEVVADQLGIPDWYANTELVWGKQNELIDYHYDRHQAERKLADLQAFCTKYGLSPQECLAVGDSDNDKLLFEATGHGVLIAAADPPAELVPYAKHTIRTLSDLPALLN